MSRTKKKEGAVRGKTTNRIINILLVLGCLTILFPLYMTVIIAFKKPSEMTNDVAGALAFPQKWSFENFAAVSYTHLDVYKRQVYSDS